MMLRLAMITSVLLELASSGKTSKRIRRAVGKKLKDNEGFRDQVIKGVVKKAEKKIRSIRDKKIEEEDQSAGEEEEEEEEIEKEDVQSSKRH